MTSQFLIPPTRRSRTHSQSNSAPAQVRQETEELDPQSICRDLASSMENFDFERFFEAFPIGSVVSQFIESFSMGAFHELMVRAFTNVPMSEYSSSQAHQARRARFELEEELHNLDVLLGFMEDARLQVKSTRDSLGWVRSINQRALDRDSLARAVREPTSPIHISHSVANLSYDTPRANQWVIPPRDAHNTHHVEPSPRDAYNIPRGEPWVMPLREAHGAFPAASSPRSSRHYRSGSMQTPLHPPGLPDVPRPQGHHSRHSTAGVPTPTHRRNASLQSRPQHTMSRNEFYTPNYPSNESTGRRWQ